ncbi:MAG: hypothetical protein WC980_10770 [Candidatus Brocadiia bacterium]
MLATIVKKSYFIVSGISCRFSITLLLLLCYYLLSTAQAQANPNDDPSKQWVFGTDSPVATAHPASQQTPAISGNIAVWIDYRPNAQGYNFSRVFYRRLPEVTDPPDQQTPAEQELVANSFSQSYPAISGNLVVWQQIVNPPSGGVGSRILYKYIDGSGPSVLSEGSYRQSHPHVSGTRVVWRDERNGARKSQIYMFDLNQGVELLISDIPGDNLQPAIDGDWVVWVKNDQYNYGSPAVNDILAKNVVTGENITITTPGDNLLQEHPAISGSKVVWTANNAGDSLLIYNLSTRQTQIIPGSEYAASASIEGNIVTWSQFQTHQIYMHDLSSGITQQVSSGTAYSAGGPAASSGHIIWSDDRDGTRAIYQNKLGDRAQQLAEKYAPHLYLHHEEYFEPRKVDIMVGGEGTRLMQRIGDGGISRLAWPDLTLNSLGQYNAESDQPGNLLEGKYVDLPGNVFLARSFPTEKYLRSDFVDRYNSLANTNNFPETTYTHIIKNPTNGQTVIQYWLPYYFDNWNNYHEGDWEHVDVILNGNLDPVAAGYSQHNTGQRRPWDFIEGPDSHPVVYVARGSHANYFFPGPHDAPYWFTDETEAYALHQPSVSMLPDVSSSTLATLEGSPFYWLAYRGAWGELTSLPGGDGPQGPAATPEHNSAWDDPLSWFNGLCWDGSDSCNEEPRGVSGSVHSPADIHLYDSQGRHVGKNAQGGIDRQIPGAEYIEIPDLHEKTITVHGGDGADGYCFVLKGTGTGTFDFTLASPDKARNSADTARHLAVPVTTFTEASVLIDPTKNYFLAIDTNGDGIIDQQRQPDSVVTQSVDLTPPAQVTDLSITNTTSGTATLSFSAPGDDGNASIAQYYDIRYSTTPITVDNWKEAMPLADIPVPQPAGTLVTATAIGLNAGATYYFAFEARDKVLQASGLSNVAVGTTTIPSLNWTKLRVYWASWADYQNRQLSIDYRMGNAGTGSAISTAVQASVCNPVTVHVVTQLPLATGDISPGSSKNVTLKYYVPTNVGSFTTTTHATCSDDAGRTYWFPGPLP